MKNNNENEFLSLAIKLAGEIILDSEKSESGLKWKTLVFEYPDKYQLDYLVDLFSGVSGISLFFLELYRKTDNNKYLDIAKESADWVINYCKDKKGINYAFYTGNLGVCWLLAQIYKTTGENSYLKQAIEFASPCSDVFLDANYYANNCLFEGRAGSLIALLHIYDISQQEEVLVLIDKFIDKLIRDIQIRPNGITWLDNNLYIKPLLCYGYGTSGIAQVFLELGAFFNNPTFFQIAEQALAYENSNWNKDFKNWPDFKKDILNARDYRQFKEELTNGNIAFFTHPSENISFANGTIGLGFVRLRALELFKNSTYQIDIDNIISKIKKDLYNQSIMDGNLGKAIFYYHVSGILNNNDFYEEAIKILKENVKEFSNQVQDCSLFNGKAGLAYLALLLSDQESNSSIFFPIIENKCKVKLDCIKYPTINIDIPKLNEISFKNRFNKTFVLIEKLYSNAWVEYSKAQENKHFSGIGLFQKFISEHGNEQLKDCFQYELEKYQLEIAIESKTLLHFNEILHGEKLQNIYSLSDEKFLEVELFLNPSAKTIATGWDWVSETDNETGKPVHFADNLEKEKGEIETLIYPTSGYLTIQEKSLSVLSSLTLEIFKEPTTIKSSMEDFLDAFEIENDEEIPQIRKMAMDYICMFLEKGVLMIK
jgi:hypothetical protein